MWWQRWLFVPGEDVGEGAARGGGDIELIGRHAAGDHLDDGLVFRDLEEGVRFLVDFRRDRPVEDAVRDSVVMEGVAEVHHEDAAIGVAIVTFPCPAESR